MKAAGTDVAPDVAGVVLMPDDHRGLPPALRISRPIRHRVHQNMIPAFTMIGVLVFATFLHLPLRVGVLCHHEGSTVLVRSGTTCSV